MGELLSPLPHAGLSERCLICLSGEATERLIGGCLSCEAPEGTTTVAAASSPALDSAPAVTKELSVCRGQDAPGSGPLICSARAGASLWSCGLLASLCAGRRLDPGLYPQCPVLPGLRCWIRASRRAAHSPEPLTEPLRTAHGVSACALQPFKELVALSPGCRCLLVSQGARGHPRPPGVLL